MMTGQLKTTALATALFAGLTMAAQAAPFGNPDDLDDAAKLWGALEQARLAGANAIQGTPYEGMEPHGAFLDTVDGTVTVGGHTGIAIVKRNYGGKGISKEAVADDPGKWLAAVTVMFKREKGYDAETKDWFWAKYGPDGIPQKNPKGMSLAGRVAKGADQGCIACHTGADGDDFVFNNDRFK